jgi:Protein of unknown function (DUF3570)
MKHFAVLSLLMVARAARGQEVTGALREGIYTDSDRTQVIRSLATVDAAWSSWHLIARESVDIVSSASIDVRTSAALDAVSSASRIEMSDRRFETTVGAAYDDGHGHTLTLSTVYATERDYTSVGASVNGALDLAARNTTLLASFGANHNWVSSIIDPTLAETMDEVSFSGGIAQVLGRSDALRLRYDGQVMSGYQASPYRNVRFGDWVVTSQGDREERGGGALTFSNTIGSPDGLPEKVPTLRVRHAAVLEWLHGFGDGIGLHTQIRLARDSWGVSAGTFGADVRVAADDWLFRVGYRFYIQSGADFFEDKYLQAPEMYTYYTSDKELGDQRGHIANADVSYTLRDWPGDGMKSSIDLQVDGLHYDYQGFTLLPSRDSLFAAVGLRIGF